MNLMVAPDYGTYAEVAITLAGFTGLVGVIVSRGEHKLTETQAMHIANLLMSTMFVVILSLVPHLIWNYPMEAEDRWIWCIRVVLVFHLAAWAIFGYFARPGGFALKNFPAIERTIVYMFAPFGIGLVLAEIFVLTSNSIRLAPFVYECVLLILMLGAMSNFLVLLLRPNR